MTPDRIWGYRDLDVVFGGDLATVPWPRAPRGHLQRTGLDAQARQLIGRPPALSEIDPRILWANQPSVVRHHAAHYLTGIWERTGTTSADMDQPLNRYPLVAVDPAGRHVLVTGHHRSLAALIEGRPVLCRVVGDPTPVPQGVHRLTVTPHLLVDPAAPVGHSGTAARITDGATVIVATLDDAAAVLAELGLSDDEIDDRLTMASTGRIGRRR